MINILNYFNYSSIIIFLLKISFYYFDSNFSHKPNLKYIKFDPNNRKWKNIYFLYPMCACVSSFLKFIDVILSFDFTFIVIIVTVFGTINRVILINYFLDYERRRHANCLRWKCYLRNKYYFLILHMFS